MNTALAFVPTKKLVTIYKPRRQDARYIVNAPDMGASHSNILSKRDLDIVSR